MVQNERLIIQVMVCTRYVPMNVPTLYYARCPYPCVKRAPHAFAYADDIGTARAISQGIGDNYLVQLAVGQCPRNCIYYVTPCQRAILEDVLASVLMTPHDLSEAEVLYSLTSKAAFENNSSLLLDESD
ncbi:hypothetical protein QYE76_013376 [Lolium multiflorum]|uniref:Uncharacterized protein n=1 Tax=Lolium multiflorum TaxID=4521 RepID=A0AAD8X7J5_LOLMU|nr:hypothetical protein QYE76_013376 [Lolium multiflorum]